MGRYSMPISERTCKDCLVSKSVLPAGDDRTPSGAQHRACPYPDRRVWFWLKT